MSIMMSYSDSHMDMQCQKLQSHREVKTLSPSDAAYIAGLVDGEGSISLTRRHRGDYRQLAVTISNTERVLLLYVLDTVGAGKITSKVTYKRHHTRSYAYGISNRQALNLLSQIQPYLRSYKSARAKLVLENYLRLTPRNGKYTEKQLTERAAFIESFFALTPHDKRQRRIIQDL